jgi:hypothetical protein
MDFFLLFFIFALVIFEIGSHFMSRLVWMSVLLFTLPT